MIKKTKKNEKSIVVIKLHFFLMNFFFTLELKVRKENDKFKFKEN